MRCGGVMDIEEWLKEAKANGWVAPYIRGGRLRLSCSKHTCSGRYRVDLDNLGEVPGPCEKRHVGQYSQAMFEPYRDLVRGLVARRHSLGLSQEEINAASGLTDGHINKLEAFDRVAQFPTLQTWASTLGLKINLEPVALPDATMRALKRRTSPLPQRQTPKVLQDD